MRNIKVLFYSTFLDLKSYMKVKVKINAFTKMLKLFGN
jgi:hypothetical protein